MEEPTVKKESTDVKIETCKYNGSTRVKFEVSLKFNALFRNIDRFNQLQH